MTDVELLNWLREARTVADVLRHLRVAQALTLGEVASYASITPSYVSMLEHGTRLPDRDLLIALLLASFSLPLPQANRILLFAGFAPMPHRAWAMRLHDPALLPSSSSAIEER